MPGFQTLGSIAVRVPILEVQCAHCPRHGYLNTARLIDEYSADLPLPDLGGRLCEQCPRHDAPRQERCALHFPQVANL